MAVSNSYGFRVRRYSSFQEFLSSYGAVLVGDLWYVITLDADDFNDLIISMHVENSPEMV